VDDFIALLNYTASTSIALTEVCSALLKTILSDEKLAAKIGHSIPKSINFSYRQMSGLTAAADPALAYGVSSKEDLVDVGYNGLSLLPKRLRQALVSPLNWQAVLRCILLRLPSAKALREAASLFAAEEAVEVIPGLASPSGSRVGRGPGQTMGAPTRRNLDVIYGITFDPQASFETLKVTK